MDSIIGVSVYPKTPNGMSSFWPGLYTDYQVGSILNSLRFSYLTESVGGYSVWDDKPDMSSPDWYTVGCKSYMNCFSGFNERSKVAHFKSP